MRFEITATFEAEGRTIGEAEASWRAAQCPGAPEPASVSVRAKRGQRITHQEWLALLYMHRDGQRFTRADFEALTGAPRSQLDEVFRYWERRGMIEVVDHVMTGRRGRPAPIYAYVQPADQGAARARRRQPTPEQELTAAARAADARSSRRAPTGRRRKVNRESDPILREAERQGATVEYSGSGHVKIKVPGRETPIIMASTPRRGGRHKDLKRLRGAGINV